MLKFERALWPFFLLLVSTLFSCGTIKSKKNILFADSEPRGLSVINEKGENLGQTPFFFKIQPGDKREFKFLKDEALVGSQKYGCKWDWGGSIVPNVLWAPLYPVGTALTTIFLFADATTKGLYVCKDSILLKTAMEPRDFADKKVIIGMPIAIGRSDLADKAIDFWTKNIFEKKKKDETFLWNEEVENEFIYRGVDLYANTDPRKIKRRFINQIGHKFKGTHFLHFELKETKTHYELTPRLYDAFTFAEVQGDYLKSFKMKKEKSTSKNYWKRVLKNIDLFPNALTLSYHGQPKEKRIVPADPQRSGEFSTNTHPEAFPKLFTLVGIETVRHPQFYSNWDWGGFLSPSFGASSWRSNYLLNGQQYNFDFESYNFGYNASLTGFSPLGQISVGAGLVASYFRLSDNRGYLVSKVGLMTRLFTNYSKFFNERFYFTMGAKLFAPSKGITDKSEYTLQSWAETYVGFGYYFPEVKAFARRLVGL